ncbi:MATE family efflux transporter [Microbacterium esteraromaticum]|uniref:MATE family efflux transporter n=1 Tax=Microbacterium esteraromaticum TaxID=57043 RepID=UPI0019D39D4B|nr:MATE family efflux transporter [Microbacterium esteraromaticum]MBN7794081.1 MATE family efflux transporter [Microbacterium esteraromaticum]
MATTLITGRPWRVILTFSVPLLIGNVVQQLYQFVDTIVVGRQLGVNSLAAVGATGSLIFLVIGFAWGLGSGFAIPTAQAFGAGDARGVRRSVATGTLLTAATSLILTLCGPIIAGPFLELMQTPPELLAEATVFTQVTFLGGSTIMFFNYLAAIIRSIGDSTTPLVFLTISCVLNVGLVILMVGPLGWGVAGAAWATVVAQAVSVVLCLLFMWRRLPVLHVHRPDWKVSGSDIAQHLRLGLPMGFQASIIAIGALIVQVALNRLGADAVAAYTAASRVDSLAVAFLASLGLAASMYAAQNLGARRPDRIRRGTIQAIWIAIAASVVLGALLIAFGEPVVRLFVGEGSDDVVDMAHLMLIINGLSYSTLGVLFVLRGVLQGIGRVLVPTITGVIELVMRVVAALALGGVWEFTGVALSNPLAWLGAILLLIPAYIAAHRQFAKMTVDPVEPTLTTPITTITTPIPVVGPSEGSHTVDAVFTAPVPIARPRLTKVRMPRVGRRRKD